MFDESEPGKPKDWGWTIGIIITICSLNLCIFIVLRVLLDASDEFGEPLFQGDTRQNLQAFLGFFALSFCFGCWCCFCCAGNCLECIIFCFKTENRPTMTQWWARLIRHKSEIVNKTRQKKDTVATDIRKISKRWKSAYSNENFSESDVEYQTPKRTQPNPSSRQQVKFNISEDEPPLSPTTSRRMEPGRRSTQWMELKRPSLHPGEATKTSVGVKNVDYYEIPVSLVTPTAVAIIDPKFVAKTEAIDESAKKTAETATVLQNEKIENVNEQHAMFYCDSPCTSAAIAFGEKKASDSSV